MFWFGFQSAYGGKAVTAHRFGNGEKRGIGPVDVSGVIPLIPQDITKPGDARKKINKPLTHGILGGLNLFGVIQAARKHRNSAQCGDMSRSTKICVP